MKRKCNKIPRIVQELQTKSFYLFSRCYHLAMGQIIKKLPHFLIIQVITSVEQKQKIESDLSETEQLIETFGGKVVDHIVQQKNHPDPNFYLGMGKVEELKKICEDLDIDVVVINDLVKSGQIFRLEKTLWQISPQILVWDRIDLILNIFDQHATTNEAKLQIKLARATHMGPRIYGLGKTELSRQGGGIGTRGKGETNIEFEKRQIKIDQQKIKKELKKLIKQKHSRLEQRKELGIGPVALVGYTSAGKTTLFNTLTGKAKQMSKGLFTTLDTVVGKLKSPLHEQPILVSDTIGFISNLPPVLFDSFKSTLLESMEAKLLLHVVDVNDPDMLHKIDVVEEILGQLKANQPRILVLNKADLVTQSEIEDKIEQIKKLFNQKEEMLLKKVIPISALTEKNIDLLKKTIEKFFLQVTPSLILIIFFNLF